MINNISLKLLKFKQKKIKNLKNKIKLNLYKFIIQNKNITIYKNKKIIMQYYYKNKIIINQNSCQYTSNTKNIKKKYTLARHFLNKQLKTGNIFNTKIKSW